MLDDHSCESVLLVGESARTSLDEKDEGAISVTSKKGNEWCFRPRFYTCNSILG